MNLTEFSAIISAISDYAAVITAIIAIIISKRTARNQEEYNRLTFMPVCELYTANFDDCLSVEIQNKGSGLMRIDNIYFSDTKGHTYKDLVDFIRDEEGVSYNLIDHGKVLMAGETIYLILFKKFTSEQRKRITDKLSNIKVHIEFRDVYFNEYVFEHTIYF